MIASPVAERDEVSDFVRMLCYGGNVHEAFLAELPGVAVDLRVKRMGRRLTATVCAAGLRRLDHRQPFRAGRSSGAPGSALSCRRCLAFRVT